MLGRPGRSAALIAYVFLMPPPGGRFVNAAITPIADKYGCGWMCFVPIADTASLAFNQLLTGPAHRCLHHPFAKTGNVSFTRLQRQLHRPVLHQSRTLQWDQPQMRNCTCGQHGPNSRWPT